MADSVKPKVVLLCSTCGCSDILKLPKFCPECGKLIDTKDFKLFQLTGSDGKHLGSKTATQESNDSNDQLSSDTGQLPSGGSKSTIRVSQVVETTTHPLSTDDDQSSSSGSQIHDQRKPQGECD